MIHLFISYGGDDRDFARLLADKITVEFEGKITTRIIEDDTPYNGKTWKEKVLTDLNKSSIFIIIFSKKSRYRQWPNQEVGYAKALLDLGKIKHLIPVVEIKGWKKKSPVFIPLSGLVINDSDTIGYEIDKQKECIEKIIEKLNKIDLKKLERETNPDLVEFDEKELKILDFIINHVYENGDKLFEEHKIISKFSDMDDDFVRDTLALFMERGILEQGLTHHFYILTSWSFFTFAPIFLGIDTAKNVNNVFNFIVIYKHPTDACNGPKINEATKLSPIEINYAVDWLERADYISVIRSAGSSPYWFSIIRLTSKGRREYRKQKPDSEAD